MESPGLEENIVFRLLRPFEYHEPGSVHEAVELLSRYGDRASVIAGGTDLLISMKKREIHPEHLVSIGRLPGLDVMELSEDGGLRLGPLATHASIAKSPLVKQHFPMLATACNKVGTPQVRNMGTIGGNICKAGPSQDTPPVLVALEAVLRLVGPDGERTVPLDMFCTGPFCTVLQPNELVVEIRVPPMPPSSAGCYKWCTKITEVDETLAGAAVVLDLEDRDTCRDLRIGLSSVAPMAIRAHTAEAALRGRQISASLIDEAARTASMEAEPRSRAQYRRHMIHVLVRDGITELQQIVASRFEEDRP
jgi:carbon-monoxide dehydrogenase medium subunit